MNHRLPRAQTETHTPDEVGPHTELLRGGSEDDVVAIDANRHMFPEHPAEGSIVLEAEEGETQEIPHQLPRNLLKGLLTIVIMDPGSEGPQGSGTQR
jgi:hypothetical protein